MSSVDWLKFCTGVEDTTSVRNPPKIRSSTLMKDMTNKFIYVSLGVLNKIKM